MKHLLFFLSFLLLFFDLMAVDYNFAPQGNNLENNIISKSIIYADNRNNANLSFVDVEDKIYNLSQYNGSLLLVYFWASWCNDCIIGMHEIDSMLGYIKSNNFDRIKIIPISVDANKDYVKKFYLDNNIKNLDTFLANHFSVVRGFDVHSLPSIVIVDKNNGIAAKYSGIFNCGISCMIEIIDAFN